MEYLHQRQATAELQTELARRRAEEETWYRQQGLLKEAEEQRRVLIAEEEQKLVDQRIRWVGLGLLVSSHFISVDDGTLRI